VLVLDQDGFTRILEEDVVLRIAFADFLIDLRVQIVLFVLGLPIAKRDAQGVQKRAVGVDPRFFAAFDIRTEG
jgi:hypothetical protein